jgi:putative transposase
MKHTTTPLVPEMYYHIYNRGNNRENLFIEKRNYTYFLSLYKKHIEPIADTYAYCLMRNHFHLGVRIKTEQEDLEYIKLNPQISLTHEILPPKKFNPSQAFSNLFNAYTKAINKAYGRTGSLFEERFWRIPVMEDAYFLTLIFYIHYNPQKHAFINNFRNWKWSSYLTLTGTGETKLKRDDILRMFGNINEFKKFHETKLDEKILATLIDSEFEVETQI